MIARMYVVAIQMKGEDYLRGRPEVVYSKLETTYEVALAWISKNFPGIRFAEEPQMHNPDRTRIEGRMDDEDPATLYLDVYKVEGASIV